VSAISPKASGVVPTLHTGDTSALTAMFAVLVCAEAAVADTIQTTAAPKVVLAIFIVIPLSYDESNK
jgi:hypothetical protein